MPIRPENRARYPKDWKAISLRIRNERARGQCECAGECGADHGGRCPEVNGMEHTATGSIVVLTVAHLDHTPENCADENLRAMCQRCHNRYDGPKRRAGIAERAFAGRALGDLFDEPAPIFVGVDIASGPDLCCEAEWLDGQIVGFSIVKREGAAR